MLMWRPSLRTDRRTWTVVLGYGVTLGLMNLCFYLSLARIPLGIAVTVEFLGPLVVALAGSRRWLDVLWAVLAAGGVVLLMEEAATSTSSACCSPSPQAPAGACTSWSARHWAATPPKATVWPLGMAVAHWWPCRSAWPRAERR